MLIAIVFSMLFGMQQPAQPDTLTLEYCYSRIENHYPLSRKIELEREITDLNKKIANTASYPQLNFGVTATYQSEVTELQFPEGGQFSGPKLSKDQYKATVDVSQTIYDGGKVGIQKNLEEVEGRRKQQEIKIQLRQIKEQVNQVYFGILLARQQLEIVESMAENIRAQINSVKSKVDNGVLLASQQYILEAELVKTRQDSTDIRSNIISGYEVLGQLIGQEISPEMPLELPDYESVSKEIESLSKVRPEFELFESNRQALDYQKELAQTRKIPSLSAFGTAAYGRPGFNVFEDDLHPYYIVGLRLQWNLWGARNAGVQQKIYNLQQKNITEEESAFERQLRGSLSKIREQIYSLQDQIKRDQEIIDLRNKTVDIISSQLKNGTATATEYITELNKATQAQLSMRMHKTRFLQAKTDYQTTLGISSN